VARRSVRRRKKRGGGASSSGGQGLTTVSLFAFVAFVLILGAALFIAQLDMANRLAAQQAIVAKTNAQRSATQLSKAVTSYQNLMVGIVTEPAIGKLIQSANKSAITEREQQLKSLFPSALQVRLLAAGLKTVDRTRKPDLSFACLDMMRNAENAKKAPEVEVHAYGTEQQHIDLVQPVLNAQGNRVVGHMQVVLDVKLIQKWIEQAVNDNYIELSQIIADKKSIPLGEAGNKEFRSSHNSTVEVPGTSWVIKAWVPPAVTISIFNLPVLIVFGCAVILVAFIVLMLRRSVSGAINADLENFMQIAIQVIRGNKSHEYSVKMKEFKEAVVRLHNMPMSNSMERERDHDPSSISMGNNQEIDPMYLSEDSMTLEELDNDDLDDVGEGPGDEPVKKPEAAPVPGSQAAGTDMPAAEIFKAYDIRGIVGKTLTANNIEVIGRALGSEAASRGLKTVAFGRDGRLSGPELGQALVKGILSTGINVLDVGMVPTPTLYYAAAEHAEGSGLMLTGSHNPPDYNGIKMVLGGETLSGDTIQALRQRIEKKDFTSGEGEYKKLELNEAYIQRITSDTTLKRKLKVVVDCGNGVAGAIAPTLFKQLGCEVIEMFCDVDGHFPNHHPDPSQPENLQDIINAVKSNHADLGLAFDGDGDRVGVVSGDGNVIWPDRLMMLFAEDVLKRNPGAQIIFDIKCSSNLMKYIWDKGGEPLMWKTGHSLIKAKMKQTGALLAGEMSGHIFFKERWYGFDDALYAAARLLEILSADMRQPRVVFASLPDAVNTPELKIPMPEGEHHKFMDRLLAEADFGDANVSMIDGVRADYSYGWGLVRASNTTPCLVLRFEGQTEEGIKKVQSRFRKALLDLKPDLQLPF
jgi:phosphomannomutase/phosphoglucomutase